MKAFVCEQENFFVGFLLESHVIEAKILTFPSHFTTQHFSTYSLHNLTLLYLLIKLLNITLKAIYIRLLSLIALHQAMSDSKWNVAAYLYTFRS